MEGCCSAGKRSVGAREEQVDHNGGEVRGRRRRRRRSYEGGREGRGVPSMVVDIVRCVKSWLRRTEGAADEAEGEEEEEEEDIGGGGGMSISTPVWGGRVNTATSAAERREQQERPPDCHSLGMRNSGFRPTRPATKTLE